MGLLSITLQKQVNGAEEVYKNTKVYIDWNCVFAEVKPASNNLLFTYSNAEWSLGHHKIKASFLTVEPECSFNSIQETTWRITFLLYKKKKKTLERV